MSAQLHVVPDAPVIQRTAYAVYNKTSDKLDLIESLLTNKTFGI
jgi:hypothetical protein